MEHNRNMRIFLPVCMAITLLIGGVFVGCSKKAGSENSALKSLAISDLEPNTIAVIINNPTTDQLKKVVNLETFDFDNLDEYILIIPAQSNMKIELKEVVWDADALKGGDVIYASANTKDGFALLLRAYRPDGIPSLMICISGKNTYQEYLVSYYGEEGTPDMEYIVY